MWPRRRRRRPRRRPRPPRPKFEEGSPVFFFDLQQPHFFYLSLFLLRTLSYSSTAHHALHLFATQICTEPTNQPTLALLPWRADVDPTPRSPSSTNNSAPPRRPAARRTTPSPPVTTHLITTLANRSSCVSLSTHSLNIPSGGFGVSDIDSWR